MHRPCDELPVLLLKAGHDQLGAGPERDRAQKRAEPTFGLPVVDEPGGRGREGRERAPCRLGRRSPLAPGSLEVVHTALSPRAQGGTAASSCSRGPEPQESGSGRPRAPSRTIGRRPR